MDVDFDDILEDVEIAEKKPDNEVLPEVLKSAEPEEEIEFLEEIEQILEDKLGHPVQVEESKSTPDDKTKELEVEVKTPTFDTFGSDEDFEEEVSTKKVNVRENKSRENKEDRENREDNESRDFKDTLKSMKGLFDGVISVVSNILVVACVIAISYFGIVLMIYMVQSGFEHTTWLPFF